jgi:putative addiction module component (TIGR02574 family)
MTRTAESKAEKVYRAALALSEAEREELVRLLTMQNDGMWASPEIEQAWMDECDRRVKAMDRGEMEMIPADEVYRRARECLSK